MNLPPKVDSKDFVDRPMRFHPDVIMHNFKALPPHPSPATLHAFVEENFAPAGSDLIPVTPPDYQPHPPTLQSLRRIQNAYDWAQSLNELWKDLGRQPKEGLVGSLLPTTHHLLVVPGGRFRESYYWDTYWIVHGLLACDMYDTARGVVQNLLDAVDHYGFCPNGGRLYYGNRSQPPLLSEMVRIVYATTSATASDNDAVKFLADATRVLEKEYAYWMSDGQHAVQIPGRGGEKVVLNRYHTVANEPRPESYREDIETAAAGNDNVYAEIAAACESGWDFSSRWLSDSTNLATCRTSQIIPVDLNSILHKMEKNMVSFYKILSQQQHDQHHVQQRIDFYQQAVDRRQQAIHEVLWDDSTKMWRDYALDTQSFTSIISASNYFPLWSQSLDTTDSPMIGAVLDSFQHHLIQPGGIATTTTTNSHQQWDMPNAWPPLQDILIEGIRPLDPDLAKSLAQRWLTTNYQVWKATGRMHEKYDVTGSGKDGGGGEYELQFGFGWTNGVVLKLLLEYYGSGDEVLAERLNEESWFSG